MLDIVPWFTSELHNEISHSTNFPADFRPTAQTQQPTVCQLLFFIQLYYSRLYYIDLDLATGRSIVQVQLYQPVLCVPCQHTEASRSPFAPHCQALLGWALQVALLVACDGLGATSCIAYCTAVHSTVVILIEKFRPTVQI